jgi:beta-glucosidase
MVLDKNDFGADFKWGVSAAAYQTEGAWNLDGKGLSIWDVFTAKRGKILKGQHANTACDFYHHYAQDIALMRQMNIGNFRFSLAWSRILPQGTGQVNYKGIDFYKRVIDFCLELDIEPWLTLYHWDLPQALEQRGGWTNRDIVNWFGNYTETCVKHFGDTVNRWMVLNEPMVFTGAGYFLGVHAPGKKGINNFLSAAHHAALCQAEGGRIIKAMQPHSKVGTTFSCSDITPYSDKPADVAAATRVDALINRMFVEPLAGKGYPVTALPLLRRIEKYMKSGDEQRLAFDMDFIGIQNYTREKVVQSYRMPFIWARLVPANKRNVPLTVMNWEVYPECIYNMLHQFNSYGFKEIIVTENGAAFEDHLHEGKVHDEKRRHYLQQHIAQVQKAQQEGVPVNGYFVWSFTDNFEWAEGYKPRFGLVHVDYSTQKRTVKSSGHWYSSFLQPEPVMAGVAHAAKD